MGTTTNISLAAECGKKGVQTWTEMLLAVQYHHPMNARFDQADQRKEFFRKGFLRN
jgi:hypothetical protein